MATLPDPRTWAVGDALTAARANLEIRDALDFLLEPPRCSLTASSVSTTHNTATLMPWDGETYDSDTMHDLSTFPSRITITTAGMYLVTAMIAFSSSSSGFREVDLRKNSAGSSSGGSSVRLWRYAPANGDLSRDPIAYQVSLAASDYLEVFALQTSGGALNVLGNLQVTWLSKQP